MNNLNSILLEGRLVADPELKTTPKGTPVATFTVASDRYFKKESNPGWEQETSFISAEAWGKLSESVQRLGKKGRGVRVVGRLKQERWTGSDGKNHEKVFIVAEHVEFRPEFAKKPNDEDQTDPSFDQDDEMADEEAPAEE